jgi:hypothetical protein
MKRLVIDLETVGPAPNGAIAAIGAAYLDDDKIVRVESCCVDPGSCVELGMTIGWREVHWWMQQSKEAREATFGSLRIAPMPLPAAIHWLVEGMQVHGPIDEVWAHPAGFDLAILETAFAVVGAPWDRWKARDITTLFKHHFPDVRKTQSKLEHDAGSDAEAHATDLIRCLRVRDAAERYARAAVDRALEGGAP